MKPIERLVMHAGRLSGMSLPQINGMLLESGLEPVTDGNWRFVERYVRLTRRDPSALSKLSFGAIRFRRVKKQDRSTDSAPAKPRFRVVKGGKR